MRCMTILPLAEQSEGGLTIDEHGQAEYAEENPFLQLGYLDRRSFYRSIGRNDASASWLLLAICDRGFLGLCD